MFVFSIVALEACMDVATSEEASEERSEVCSVCAGSYELLGNACPLCCNISESGGDAIDLNQDSEADALPKYYCKVCRKDMQSAVTLEQHKIGRVHLRRSGVASSGTCARQQQLSSIMEEDLFCQLARGEFQHIVVCTGAGVSTEAGIQDFRSPGGLFDQIRHTYGERFPAVMHEPETLMSRTFASTHPAVWHDEVQPWLRSWKYQEAEPASGHRFCAWLHRRGWLKRIYTQNVDGLHARDELKIPSRMVVECHGALRDATIVLYGDQLPRRFETCCAEDFPQSGGDVDLVLVFGTSLQVAPFCGVPNMARTGCTRVLVNQCLADCRVNDWSRDRPSGYEFDLMALGLGGMPSRRPAATTRIGARKEVQLRPLWWDAKSKKRWKQLCIESSCRSFVQRFFASPVAQELSLTLDS